MDWVTVLSLVFALIGGAMLVAGAAQFGRRRTFLLHSTTAAGIIVARIENLESRDGDARTYFPKVTFRTSAGREVTFQSEMASSGAGQIGETVRVRYRVDQPHVAEIDSFMALWGSTMLFGALGAVFLFVGLGILTGLLPV
jgi:hypothetical protein